MIVAVQNRCRCYGLYFAGLSMICIEHSTRTVANDSHQWNGCGLGRHVADRSPNIHLGGCFFPVDTFFSIISLRISSAPYFQGVGSGLVAGRHVVAPGGVFVIAGCVAMAALVYTLTMLAPHSTQKGGQQGVRVAISVTLDTA